VLESCRNKISRKENNFSVI